MLSNRQIHLIEATWAMVVPIADAASTLFYDRLFKLDPDLRPLFPSDMAEQRKKLMRALTFAVASLQSPETLVPILQEMGRRHSGYGVMDDHFDTVSEALLWTLAAGLGAAFTPEAEAAWTVAYGLVSDTMRAAMTEAVA